MPNFAAVTAPLLRMSMKWVWSERCQEAFAHVKATLSSPPVLRAPDFQRPFLLAVDACDVGVGAVLLQVWQDSYGRPVAYFSKKLNKHQQAYSTIEKEALALAVRRLWYTPTTILWLLCQCYGVSLESSSTTITLRPSILQARTML